MGNWDKLWGLTELVLACFHSAFQSSNRVEAFITTVYSVGATEGELKMSEGGA